MHRCAYQLKHTPGKLSQVHYKSSLCFFLHNEKPPKTFNCGGLDLYFLNKISERFDFCILSSAIKIV